MILGSCALLTVKINASVSFLLVSFEMVTWGGKGINPRFIAYHTGWAKPWFITTCELAHSPKPKYCTCRASLGKFVIICLSLPLKKTFQIYSSSDVAILIQPSFRTMYTTCFCFLACSGWLHILLFYFFLPSTSPKSGTAVSCGEFF